MKHMNLNRKLLVTGLLGVLAVSAAVIAQPGGPDGRDGDKGPPPMRSEGRGEMGPGGPGGPGGGGAMNSASPDRQRGYLDLVGKYAELAQDPTASAVGAVLSTNDMIMRSKGPKEAIEYFNQLLPRISNPTVERAVRLILIDHYRGTKQYEKTIEQAELIILGANPTTKPVGGQ